MANVHNPDQYMASLRQIIGQGQKRIGFLVGSGAPASMKAPGGTEPLIPTVPGLTVRVLESLDESYEETIDSIKAEIPDANIETILSRVRSLANVVGKNLIYGFDAAGHTALGEAICVEIGKIVNQSLPDGQNPYANLVNWISGTSRTHAVEIFTTNYDLLFEQALERAKVPFFDGFTGANQPFFDPSSVANNDLPSRWARLWKLHGSLGWRANSHKEVIRIGGPEATHLVFPEHLKYDQTQKAPYSALFDRLRAFLMTPDTLLVVSGFSFRDAHISARIDECLSANPSASVFAFQFGNLTEESCACDIASRRPNMSVYARDKAVINGIAAQWSPGDLPTRDWAPIRATYWGTPGQETAPRLLLGSFDCLAYFFAASGSQMVFTPSATAGTTVAGQAAQS